MTDPPQPAPDAWDEADSEDFLDAATYFVPRREVQIDTLCRVVPPLPDGARLVELCCGEGLLAEQLAARFPESFVHAFDRSTTMVAETSGRLARFGPRCEVRRFRLEAEDWRRFPWPVHAVVSSLAIHHLDGPGKAALFRDMARVLAPGGALVVCDLVEALTPEGRALFAAHWDEGVRARSLERDGDLGGFEFFQQSGWNLYAADEPDPGDVPSPLVDQLDWMRAAGLERIEVHWLEAGHAIWSGRKPG